MTPSQNAAEYPRAHVAALGNYFWPLALDTTTTMPLGVWFHHLITLQPHVTLHNGEYVKRWWLLPRNRWFNAYLHCFNGPDPDACHHDHPFDNLSIILWGGYDEEQVAPQWKRCVQGAKDAFYYPKVLLRRRPGHVIFRRAHTPHTIKTLHRKPTWTLFLTGPTVREWGFHTAYGWVYWRTHTNTPRA